MTLDIQKHLVIGPNTDFQESPNQGIDFAEGFPDTIIIHYTAGGSSESSANHLCDPKAKASAHIIIGRDGKLIQLVPFSTVAWHAGNSSYKGRNGFNNFSIGIELDNAGRLQKKDNGFISWFGHNYAASEVLYATHQNESIASYWHTYTEIQLVRTYELCELLIKKYPIQSLLGHEEISPGKKSDPGPAFPLNIFRQRLIIKDRNQNDSADRPISPKHGIVLASQLNVRRDPSIHASLSANPLTKGQVVTIHKQHGKWYQITGHITGWVAKEYIKE